MRPLRLHQLVLVVIATSIAVSAFGASGASDETPPSGWLSTVQQRIAAEEYHLTWQDGTYLPDVDDAWQAPNRTQGFRTYFTAEGIRVIPRTESEPSWEWGLTLVRYGRGGRAWAVGGAALLPDENRIDYDRGDIVERYVNAPRGLKQGFALSGPPEERDRDGAGPARETVAPKGPGSSPITGAESDRIAYVELELIGTLAPTFSTDGQAIDFVTGRGVKVVHFAELKVTDATGRELTAWMEGSPLAGSRAIRLVFVDEEAVYPVTIDPLATTQSWTAEGNQPDAWFGGAVGTAGDVNGDGYSDVIIGAEGYDGGFPNEGGAFVYHGSAAGLESIAAWSATGGQANAGFGVSVGTAGDVNGDGFADVIVGARLFDNDQANEGRAFVYHGSAAGLSGTANWTAEGDQAGASFGGAVGTAGDVNGDGYSDVIVGAYLHPSGGYVEAGRVYVYHGSAAGLGSAAAWTAESGQASAWFGWSVGTAGDVNGDGYADVIIGSHLYDAGQGGEGSTFVFHGSVSGLNAGGARPVGRPQNADWTAESDQPLAYFGISVGTAGDVNGDGYADVIVGAHHYTAGQSDEGRAFVFLGSVSGLETTASWTAESDQASAHFGAAVRTAGDVNGDGYADVIVGSPEYDHIQSDEGRAFVYLGGTQGLRTLASWITEANQAGARYGHAVGTAGDVNGDGYADVVVGAFAYDQGQTDEGVAFAFHGSAAGLAVNEGWTAEGNQSDAFFGRSVGTAGDVNGDGYADVIIGAYHYDNGETDEGRAYVYHGSAAGLSEVESWTVESHQASAAFGFSVSTAGDVNGDGYADVVVGAVGYDNHRGRTYVYHGSESGLSDVADWTAEGNQTTASFGYSVSTAGDVNGDGYADVAVGEHERIFVYHGSVAGLGSNPYWTAAEDALGFGFSLSTAGDVNGDGYSDVVVGSYGHYDDEGNWVDLGRAYVYHGSVASLSEVPDWTEDVSEIHVDRRSHLSVSTAGDVNGDGYADIIVGAPVGEQRARVYNGSAAGLSTAPDWTAESNQEHSDFGGSVATAGDVNGDGYADVIVGAEYYDNGEPVEGRTFVYLGSAAGLSIAPDWTAEGNQAEAHFGFSVGTAGDVNGDGYADVIVGAVGYDNDESDEGRVYLYYGNDGAGLSLRPQQRRADDSAPVVDGGKTMDADGFRLAALGRTPFGRGRVMLEWEVKPRGVPFDGVPTGRGDEWVDTGTDGAALNELISGLDQVGHHWRARLLYDPATTPLQPASRWFTVPWNGWTETDLTVGCPIETCNGVDDDCDGLVDENEAGQTGDADGDGLSGLCDCDDADVSVYPGAPQICDGVNNDCDDPRWPTPPTDETDADVDGVPQCADCDDTDPTTYPGANEVNDGQDNQCPGDDGHGLADEISGFSGYGTPGDDDTFCWPAQIGATRYQIVRSTDDPSFASDCSVVEETGTCHTDTEDPPPGSVFYYLVRALEPNPGSWGTDGNGNERNVACGAGGTNPENMASAHDRIVNDATVGVMSNPGSGSPNRLLYLDGAIPGPPSASWGLDRANQRLGLDQNGSVSGTGDGVHVYVLGTGIRTTHQVFAGRADCFFDWEQGNDCADGHGTGTYVASLVAGDSYGWATNAMVHAVRVLDDLGSGTPSNIEAGLDAIAAAGEIPGVVVHPLGGGVSDEIDAAVQRVIDAGFYVVAAAGDTDADACNQSPASVPEILTVGATDVNDTRAWFSNWGSCVDLFAPGVSITGAHHTHDSATTTRSGTLAAAAFVGGAVAVHAERGNLLANDPTP